MAGMKWWASALGTTILFAPSLVSAHVLMTDPTPRSGENGLTAQPCGDVPAGPPAQFMAGETITVSWTVGQTHGGSLQIDFSEADDMNFGDYLLAMGVSDAEGMPTSVDVQLPNINCDACTLRLIQVNPNEADYVSCADVQLMGATEGTTGGSGGGDESTGGGGGDSTGGGGGEGSSGDGGASATDTGGGGGSASASASGASASASGGGDDAPVGDDGGGTLGTGDGTGGSAGSDEDSGGCRIGTTARSGSPWLLLGALGLWLRRRRRG